MHRSMSAVMTCMMMLIGCSQSEAAINATVNARLTDIANETLSALPSITPTPAPTKMPTTSPTPTQTDLPTLTPTPALGSFANPAGEGDTVIRSFSAEDQDLFVEMSLALLGVEHGEEAKQIARENLDWVTYKEPLEGQEYLAVRIQLKFIDALDENNVTSLYPYWSVTLRYEESGFDIWSVDAFQIWDEGYLPLEGEGWVLFLIREGSNPFLYFQPLLMVLEQFGIRTVGAYFALET